MKYIRTTNGKIIDVKDALRRYKNGESLDDVTLDILLCIIRGTKDEPEYSHVVIKEADTIEGLIMHNDLVEYDGTDCSKIMKVMGDCFVGYYLETIKKERITALYVANDDDVQRDICDVDEWTFVAKKDKNGEWELL